MALFREGTNDDHIKVHLLHIHNFRELKSSRIDLANKEIIFVGANNSGKTSASHTLTAYSLRRWCGI